MELLGFFTPKGKALSAKLLTGVPLQITRITAGDGNTPADAAAPLDTARFAVGAAALGGYALFVGGTDGDAVLGCADLYDGDLVHTVGEPIQTARYNISAASIGSYALFAGGQAASGQAKNTVEAYTVPADVPVQTYFSAADADGRVLVTADGKRIAMTR